MRFCVGKETNPKYLLSGSGDMTHEGDETKDLGLIGELLRNDKETLIAEKIIPNLDDPRWKQEFDPSQEHVEEAQKELAEQYVPMTKFGFVFPIRILLLLVIVDSLFYLNAQVYGLSVGLYGAMLMVVPDLKGRYVIATISEGNDAAQRKLAAQNMAFSNTAFVLIAIGFLLQIAAVQFLPSPELFGWNYFPDEIFRRVTEIFSLSVHLS